MVGLHAVLGIGVLVGALAGSMHARSRVRSGRAYDAAPYWWLGLLLAVQVAIGTWNYLDQRAWEAVGLMLQVHVGIGVLCLALVLAGLRHASRERWAAQAYVIASRTQLASALAMGVAVVVGHGV